MFELFDNAIILGERAWVWPIFVAVIVLIITAIARSIFPRQMSIETKKPERYLTLRIDEIPIDTSDKTLGHELKKIGAQDPDLRNNIRSVSQISLASRDSRWACATATFHTSIPETELVRRLQRASEKRMYKYDSDFYGITPLYGGSGRVDVE